MKAYVLGVTLFALGAVSSGIGIGLDATGGGGCGFLLAGIVMLCTVMVLND